MSGHGDGVAVSLGEWAGYCGVELPDEAGYWTCTRDPGHDGRHEATNGCRCGNCTPEVLHAWTSDHWDGEDTEVFCPDCAAGMESSEHHEKCVVPAERREDELYMARADRAMPLWAELLRIRDNRGNDAAVERLTEVLHEVADEAAAS